MNISDTVPRTLILAIAKTCSCSPDSLSLESTLDEIGLDSLGMEAVISEVQESCGIQLSADQLMQFFEVSKIRDIASVFCSTTSPEEVRATS